MKQTFTEFWLFLKSPSFKVPSSDKKAIWKDFLWLLLIQFLFTIPLISLHQLLIELKLVKEYEGLDLFKEYGVYWGFAIVCFFAPLIEECLFRWQLTKQYASIYFIILSMTTMIIFGIKSEFISWLVFLFALIFSISLHLLLKRKSQTFTYNLQKKYFPMLFYFTAVIFGLIHLSNYKGLSLIDPSILFYIVSQFFGGLILGYLRIKYGLWYSILFHACFNLIVISLEVFFG